MNEEQKRLATDSASWRKWGPYLAERQWATVREDYSADGDAWNYFPFAQASARAYRWGEDGIGGISDSCQRMCLSFAFWNGQDPFLKERFFGLNNTQGNHGEDVKECYYYLDNTPTHSYMQMLYKYPQAAYPYQQLIDENKRRSLRDPEFELVDTGVFQHNRYFDIFLEYAKGDADDLLLRVRVENRSDAPAKLHVLPQLWLRNTWSWTLQEAPGQIAADQTRLSLNYEGEPERFLYFEGAPELLFTENETNSKLLFGAPNRTPFVKDAFSRAVVQGQRDAVNPEQKGTKAALHYTLTLPPKQSTTLRLRLTTEALQKPFGAFDALFTKRQREADQFYRDLAPQNLPDELRAIQRQAFGGLLWNKQYYHYVIETWLNGDNPLAPPPLARKKERNAHWKHFYSGDVFSMPDSWEYPWFAAWDLGFHCIPLALLDLEFAKQQLALLTRDWYMHPNGQIPAYEWNFEDVNPPVLSWATWRVYKIGQRKHGQEDRPFLEQMFHRLIMNFTWWVNRKDTAGRNVFEGGFLGLDNISVFNRSEQLPQGSELTQSDATSWMAMFCLNMWGMAMELAGKEPIFEDMASKFFKHFLYIADAINFQHPDAPALWDEEDGFYYDVLQKKDGTHQSLKIRSMVGLIPLFAVAILEEEKLESLPDFKARLEWFLAHRTDLCVKISPLCALGVNRRRLLSLLNRDKLTRILETMLDENEFLSPYGIRSISKIHRNHPFVLQCNGNKTQVDYEPAESTSRLFGGNSNWRGPIWFPLNYLIIESLQKYHHYYGDTFKIECPTGSGNFLTLNQVAEELSRRLVRIFEKDAAGRRAVFGDTEQFQSDPHFEELLQFHEYFDGDTGKGLGASHQTGWTALVAKLIQQAYRDSQTS